MRSKCFSAPTQYSTHPEGDKPVSVRVSLQVFVQIHLVLSVRLRLPVMGVSMSRFR